jgi:aminoglycoside phosphotransferase (APT) family kinase protein
VRPWLPEREVSPALARALVESQFPQLAPAQVAPLGEGWDNTVYTVNEKWVFRFPRRQIAVPLLETELRVLPSLPQLPLPIPRPEFHGAASEPYPWPFAGYPLIAGRTADQAGLTLAERERAARPLGQFLKALHALPAAQVGPDRFNRLAADKLRGNTRDRLRELGVGQPDFFDAPLRSPRADTLVHGDLHARQILVLDGAISGVIDWGDLHAGDPASDLGIAYGLLPPSARQEFRRAYGPVDEDTWALARMTALCLGAALGVYAKSLGDDALHREALTAIDFATRTG